MAFILDADQQLLARTARDFVRARTPLSSLRRMRDGASQTAFDPGVYAAMAELGWCGLTLPEVHDGMGLGYAELGIVFEELGRELVASPLLSTLVLGATTLLEAGDDAQRSCLAAVAEGDHLIALAYQEGPRHAPYRCSTRAEASDAGFVLRGEKHFVMEGATADTLLVLARTSGAEDAREGLSLFALEQGAQGLSVSGLGMVDSRAWAHLALDGVALAKDRLVGPLGGAADVLERVFDRATIVLSAEMLGAAEAAFEMTLDYLKTRKQFGVLIGSFQALKHRAADLYTEPELTRSCVLDALRAVDEGREDVPLAASIAKARASEVLQRASAEGIQMHGGIGVTDEHDIGFYYKRARTAELCLGDASYHRERFASLSGY